MFSSLKDLFFVKRWLLLTLLHEPFLQIPTLRWTSQKLLRGLRPLSAGKRGNELVTQFEEVYYWKWTVKNLKTRVSLAKILKSLSAPSTPYELPNIQ